MPNDTTAKRYAVTLTKFRFPEAEAPPYKLEDDQLDFRLQVDLRYMDSEKSFAVKTVILPGLDRFWECSENMRSKLEKQPQPDHVYARADNDAILDTKRVGAWDTRFRICACALYEMRVTVFDVEHENWLDRTWDVLRGIGRTIRQILPFGVQVETARSGSEWTLKAVAEDAEVGVGARMIEKKGKILFIGTAEHNSHTWRIGDDGNGDTRGEDDNGNTVSDCFALTFKATEL